ncbi:aminopeptidase N [Thauera linaloolentis]|uniref:Aminopeptidase N n=1 Tax=Thauera linaloolentis (strain DSM 12138 / JCM 21573 / CCUG 41526 / CIP 105981 / IAM 15112 / NBRC 102519 / 47Lol) TaxID=1123367 RepID=N6Z3P2_THAL4|nr:aminopeptidase N [Thauera linaloolentis]ENO86759.1 aminopeptidase N [Thauera linaloolentis 47Lol = DSM 12138]MCM8567048.1 aminopeptidase N [Thauera linaloolentis]
MKTEHAPTIQRADYRPLSWTVETVDLHFALDPEATVVTNRMLCVRNPDADAGPIRLWGEDLKRLSLTVDGQAPAALRESGALIEIDAGGDRVVVEVRTRIDPKANTTLSGLYLSNGGFFTQCEAEGFRRITCFPDRPDVMARFTVTLEADRANCPVLLSNGNLIGQGELPDGRHYARWEDPFPKPCYLFALVAADLVALERTVQTMSGREVLLQVWVEEGNLDRCGHAMDSLVHSMRWDEETFGLELDLDRFMIVAVADFNMGAMENKGLNIFNTKFVLAKPDTATDIDYEHVESVVAHEYFHNWTGNRVTCRDWFQLTLKEGLTVFRDQQFSADMLARAAGAEGAASARAVKRIDDVRVLRAAQFPEDAGPMAHPIRPDSYQEINNFYTATVYEKGAEVIRMLHTLLGQEGFRNGMDLYFSYHDGEAVTCDDFVEVMSEANNGFDLDQFMRWYSQAGTPRVKASGEWNAAVGSYTLTLAQYTPATPGQHAKLPLVIPVAVGLIGPDGRDCALRLDGEAQDGATTRVLKLTADEQRFRFVGLAAEPVPSLLRGFSAPVVLELDEDDARLAFRMAHDADPFNRWDAAQRYAERVVLAMAADAAAPVPDAFVAAFRALLGDGALDPAFRAQALALPGEAYLLERMAPAEPLALRAALVRLMRTLGERLAADWLALFDAMQVPGEYRYHPADAGRRALANLALRYLAAAGDGEGLARAQTRFEAASNMTERFGALAALVQSTHPAREAALEAFHARYRDDALVLDKWFALQAGAWRWDDAAAPVLDRVRALLSDPAFSLSNPNKVYALLGTYFRANPGEFHAADGSGHAFWAEQVIALNGRNPQVAARMARALESWRRFTPALQASIRAQLERVLASEGLSPDVAEVVGKALDGA